MFAQQFRTNPLSLTTFYGTNTNNSLGANGKDDILLLDEPLKSIQFDEDKENKDPKRRYFFDSRKILLPKPIRISPTVKSKRFDKFQTSIAALIPHEIIFHILSFLRTSKDLCNASRVCKEWCKVARDSSLWDQLFKYRAEQENMIDIMTIDDDCFGELEDIQVLVDDEEIMLLNQRTYSKRVAIPRNFNRVLMESSSPIKSPVKLSPVRKNTKKNKSKRPKEPSSTAELDHFVKKQKAYFDYIDQQPLCTI